MKSSGDETLVNQLEGFGYDAMSEEYIMDGYLTGNRHLTGSRGALRVGVGGKCRERGPCPWGDGVQVGGGGWRGRASLAHQPNTATFAVTFPLAFMSRRRKSRATDQCDSPEEEKHQEFQTHFPSPQQSPRDH